MLTNLDMNIFKSRAERLPDRALALAIQTAIRQQSHERMLRADTQRIDAWVTALKLEKARRSGQLHSFTDEDEIARRWPEVGKFLHSLRANDMDASIEIIQINGEMVINMRITGDADLVNDVITTIQESAAGTTATVLRMQREAEDV